MGWEGMGWAELGMRMGSDGMCWGWDQMGWVGLGRHWVGDEDGDGMG